MDFIAIILGLLPGFVWLLFYLQEDVHPEPKKMIAKVFFAGAFSAAIALSIELFANCAIAYRFAGCAGGLGQDVQLTPLLVIVFAAVEEISKFAMTYFVIAKSEYFDEPIDAMVYMAVAALGFATVENIGALSGQTSTLFFNDIFEIAIFRLVGTTLLHTLTASVTGYFWALGIRNFKRGKFIIYGIALATALHAAFNYLILASSNLLFPIVFVAIVGFFILGDFEKLKGKNI